MKNRVLLLLAAGLGLAWWFARKTSASGLGPTPPASGGSTGTDPYARSRAMDAQVQQERKQELVLRQQALRQATQVLEGLDNLRKYRPLTMSEAQRGADMLGIAQKAQTQVTGLQRAIAAHGG